MLYYNSRGGQRGHWGSGGTHTPLLPAGGNFRSVNHIKFHDGVFTLCKLAERAMYPVPTVVYGVMLQRV